MYNLRPGDRVMVHVPHGFEGFATVVRPVWAEWDPMRRVASHYIVRTAHRQMTIESKHISPAR